MTATFPVSEHQLGNGLRIVVCEDHVAPVVAVNVWYAVGSRHESPERTGLAHLFEHLMFQGSSQVGPGEHFSLLQGVGGTLNGTTSFDRTNYFESVPVHAVELALWLEADRMGSLLAALTQDNLDNQRDVVKNERRQRYDNVPYGTAWERMFALAFPPGHPYHHMPIGSMEHLDAADLQDCRAFFTTYYAPGNAVLSVVGDITPDRAVDLVERYFDGVPAQPAPPPAPDGTIGPMTAAATEEVGADVPAQAAYALWRIAPDGTPECDAADLACRVLADGGSSRLVSRLVRRGQLAQGVSLAAERLIGGSSVVALIARARDGVTAEQIVTAADEELARFAAEGPSESELARAKAQAERDWLDRVSEVEGLADELSRAAVLHGDPQRVNTVLDRIAAVTPEQVRTAVADRLGAGNRALLLYRPTGAEAAA